MLSLQVSQMVLLPFHLLVSARGVAFEEKMSENHWAMVKAPTTGSILQGHDHDHIAATDTSASDKAVFLLELPAREVRMGESVHFL
jgi:hypothetical protein